MNPDLARERRVLGAVMQRLDDPMYGPVIARGQGAQVWDTAGNRYFDLTCGYSAANFGHAFPPLVQAAQEQLSRLTHVTGMSHPGRGHLAELLVSLCGNAGDQVIFNTSGSRAIETAIKIAWANRPGQIVSIGSAYHGRSLFTTCLSDTPRVAATPLAACNRRPLAEMAYCGHCAHGLTYPGCQVACAQSLLAWIEQEQQHISAIIAEPAYGARGYIAPPAEYWQRVREVTRRSGILMIADEIQMGLGRSGHWLLSRAQGWAADLIVLGKSLAGGIAPISAVIGPARLMDALPRGSESETFAASPLATAVAIEVMQQLRDGPWLERTAWIAAQLREGLRYWDGRVESLGASVTLEFLTANCEPALSAERARAMAIQLRQAGLLVHYSGPLGTRVVLLPPLTVTPDEMQEILGILRQTL